MSEKHLPPGEIDAREARLTRDYLKEHAARLHPSPYWSRYYKFPKGYPEPELLKAKMAESLIAPRMLHPDAAVSMHYIVAHACEQLEFPLYLLSRPLCDMLLLTDWPADCSLHDDAAPPFPAATVVVPSKLACDSTGAALQAVSWAVTDTPGVPLSEGRKDFLVTCQLSNYEAYYGRWHLSSDGTLKVAPWNDQGTEFPDKGSEGFSYVWEQGEPFMGQVVRFLTTLFVALNCDKGEAVAPPRLIKAVKGKRPGMPVRNFMRPAMIGMDLKPSGFATHGERAAVSSHLRRGHMKWVRFGEGRKERKRVWIRHTMVHAKQKSEQPS